MKSLSRVVPVSMLTALATPLVATTPSAASASSTPELAWSSLDPIPGMFCTHVNEPADPHTWHDNYLCSNNDYGIQWSHSGPIAGMDCTHIVESADPYSWDDNYLCVPPGSPLNLSWGSGGPTPGLTCTQLLEIADPHTWSDNYLCHDAVPEPELIGHWTFEPGYETVDATGQWGDLQVFGDASISGGQLNVHGSGTVASGWASAPSYAGGTIREKTLVSWVALDDLNVRAGSALTIDNISGDNFDGIIYAERQPLRWMSGSCGDYPNHGQYVSCVAHASNDARKSGLLSNKERAGIVRAAAKSVCE